MTEQVPPAGQRVYGGCREGGEGKWSSWWEAREQNLGGGT